MMHAPVLRYFEAVAETGSMRRAAERLNVASSAVNRQILRLEADLGVTLFHRLPRGVELTAAGDLLLGHVRRTLSEFASVQEEIAALSGLRTGRVTVSAIDSLMVDLLPNAIAAFHSDYPLIACEVDAESPMEIIRGLRGEKIDIGISFVPARAGRLTCKLSIAAPLGLIVKPDHPLAGRERVRMADCAAHSLLLQADTMPIASVIEEEMAESNVRAKAMIVSKSLLFHKRMILNGAGSAFFTPLAFLPELGAGDLVYVPLDHPALLRQRIGLFVSADRQPSPAAEMMLEHLSNWLTSLEQEIKAFVNLLP